MSYLAVFPYGQAFLSERSLRFLQLFLGIYSRTYGSRRKEILDSVSATVILEDYLAWRKEHPGEI